MENWRPDGFKNPYTDTMEDVGQRGYISSYHRAFERGADAMLEALKKGANAQLCIELEEEDGSPTELNALYINDVLFISIPEGQDETAGVN